MKFKTILFIFLSVVLSSCTVSYKFNGASIDYTKTKTISIQDFKNLAPLVNPTLAPEFNESLRDAYSKQTRLQQVKINGDLELEGEVTGYDLTPMSLQSDAVAAETRLTVTINVRYHNKHYPQKDFEQKFSAFQNYSNTQTLTQVQDELCKTIIDEIVDEIFNKTVADW